MSLRVDAEGNASGFYQMLQGMKQHAKQFSGEINTEVGKSWGGLGKGLVGGIAGALGFEMLKGAVEAFLDKAAGIKELSEQLEMGTDETQKWQKATDRLGLSFGGLQSALAAIAQAREQALTDPKEAAKFERLGIPREDVLDTKRVNQSDFAAQVMKAGRGDEEHRAALVDIVGKRGAKYGAAADIYGSMKPDMDKSSIETAANVAQAKKSLGSWITQAVGGTLGGIGDVFKAIKRGDWRGKQQEADDQLAKQADRAVPATSANSTGVLRIGQTGKPNDPLKEIEAEEKAKRDERRTAVDDRIEEARRRNMTEEDQKLSIQRELAENRQRQADLAARTAKGAPKNLKTADERADWETKMYEEMGNLRVKEEGLKGDLREKPLSLQADSLTKSGLVTQGGMNFSTGGGTERAQLDVLRSIDRKMTGKNLFGL